MKLHNARKRIDINKNSRYAMVINSLQIGLTLVIAGMVFFSPYFTGQLRVVKLIVLGAAALVSWGAVVDIREALAARRTILQIQDMESSLHNIETLNHTLRAQRHDFLNHLQVVYSLIEMEEHQEANAYIEKVYGSIASVSRVLKTKTTAVNALLQVKIALMEKLGIQCELSITSTWEGLTVPGWEMCRVLSNLIDNAIDAVADEQEKHISLTLGENLKQFTFQVANNGPAIPEKMLPSLFLPGITTKSEGHGMGLFIVKRTLEAHYGDISVESDGLRTVFSGFVPKALKGAAETKNTTTGRKS